MISFEENGQNRNGDIEDQKELGLTLARVLQGASREKTEKAKLVKIDRKHRHRNEQNEDLKRIDRGIGKKSRRHRTEIDRMKDQKKRGTDQRYEPIRTERKLAELQLRKEQNGKDHHKAGDDRNNNRRQHRKPPQKQFQNHNNFI